MCVGNRIYITGEIDPMITASMNKASSASSCSAPTLPERRFVGLS